MTYTLKVTGIPKGQPRAKSRVFKNKSGKMISSVYNPSTANGWKALIQQQIALNQPKELLKGPLQIVCHIYMPRPKSHYRTGSKSHLLKDNAPFWYDKTPDNDNLEKAIYDAISDTCAVWKDDKQIAMNLTDVCYSETPGATIEITQLTVPIQTILNKTNEQLLEGEKELETHENT